ncbi:hypothetical protein SAMN05661044_05492 [Olivibacter domesticus]|uniref:Uncharacterized protein n=1 Tax=Olivibacter domesticus TaxID=407022 RepID=A0A1H7ZEV2_OLID1|nr:hypothetical protein SAMN05661044_05492 [Olivibacter domesticus]
MVVEKIFIMLKSCFNISCCVLSYANIFHISSISAHSQPFKEGLLGIHKNTGSNYADKWLKVSSNCTFYHNSSLAVDGRPINLRFYFCIGKVICLSLIGPMVITLWASFGLRPYSFHCNYLWVS